MNIPSYTELITVGSQRVEWIPIGIVMNPKLRVPCLAAIQLTDEEPTLHILTMLGRFIGSARIDYLSPFAKSSGYPRIHTEIEWSHRGEGWATPLYLSGAYAADILASHQEQIGIDLPRSKSETWSFGVCSSSQARSVSANRWWSLARARKISFFESVLIPRQLDDHPVVFRAPASSSVREHGVSIDTMNEALVALLGSVHQGAVEVEIEKGTVSVKALGIYRYETEIDVLLSNAAEETHTLLAVPTELRGYSNKGWSRTVFEDASPDGWTLVSPKALSAIDPHDMIAQRPEWTQFAAWWVRFLRAQQLPAAELERWISAFGSGASGAIARPRRAPARPPRAWAQLP